MAVLHVSVNTEPYLLAEVRVSETSEPTDGTFVGDMSFQYRNTLSNWKGLWFLDSQRQVFWVGQRSDQFVAWRILDNYHFCTIIRHAFHCVFVLASALPSTCKRGPVCLALPQDK